MVFDWIDGAKVLVRHGDTGITGNVYCGLHEFSDMAFLLHLLKPEDNFLDVGANVGSYTILASSVIGAQTCSVEPVPSTFSRLEFNVKLNDLEGQVTCLNIGLGDQAGELKVSSDLDTMNHIVADNEDAESTVTVPISTLDEIIHQTPLLIKIDVEGYETPVLHGGQGVLTNEKLCAVIMELNGSGDRYGFDEKEILTLMSGYGFETFSYDPFQRKLHNLSGKNLSAGNTLFIRNVEFVRDRLLSAKKIDVNNVKI